MFETITCRKLSVEDEYWCNESPPIRIDGWVCSLKRGHIGNHHAHYGESHDCRAVWTKEGVIIIKTGD